ncbi:MULTISPECIES: phosphatase PAP2 family protein [Paenibacillus]|uniref:Undecaprenyl-diphosphatase n=1 Tax=Paenibacillus pabuli TaxID=1472 RepID=A0A855Y216_9BACL|nr:MULTISPECIES: phosphatase PAP2 family protein [Paenibacillus]PWW35192.1 undecaprenyl-diphosphatase [Paenibacillus pabuli]PXW01950.1 undecaprenyl-diphosphatase [Paenibacillus taichungensis]
MLRKTHSPTSGLARKTSVRPLLNWAGVGIIASVSVVFLLAALGALLGTDAILSLDDWIQQLFYLNSDSRLHLLPFISFITALGSFRLSAIAAIGFSILFLWQRRPRFLIYGYALLSSFAMMWILNTLLKEIFRRSRPELEHLLVVHGYSFPSGHAMISMGFYGMLFVIWAFERHQRESAVALPVLCGIIFIFLVGLSRIMLGVHFPTDVFAGFAAGLAWIFCLIKGIQRSV